MLNGGLHIIFVRKDTKFFLHVLVYGLRYFKNFQKNMKSAVTKDPETAGKYKYLHNCMKEIGTNLNCLDIILFLAL